MLLELGGAGSQAVAVGHAPGELREALREHALAAVAAHHAGIEGHAGQRRIGHLARHALRHRLALEVLEPALERRVVAAWRRERRRRQCAGKDDRAKPECCHSSHHRYPSPARGTPGMNDLYPSRRGLRPFLRMRSIVAILMVRSEATRLEP